MTSGSGERSLQRLLRDMNPVLNTGEYVFCTTAADTFDARAVAVFREAEATTVVMPRHIAEEQGLSFEHRWAWITLTIHSDLSAVGFLAAVTRALAAAGISANVFSAVYHDHLFVPYDERDRAMHVLRALQLSPLDESRIQ